MSSTSEMIIGSCVYRHRFEGSIQINVAVLYKHCACVRGGLNMFGTCCGW